jgi:methyl-accepting chemotaxis protein
MNKWSLNSKIYFVMGILIAGSLLISYMGLARMSDIKQSLNSIVNGSAARLGNAHEVKELFFVQLVNEKNLILEDDASAREVLLKRLQETDLKIKNAVDSAEMISTEAGIKNWKQFESFYVEWDENNDKIQKLLIQNNQNEAAKLSMTKGREVRLKVEALLDSIVVRNENFMRDDTQKAEDDYATARNLVITIAILALVLGIGMATYVLKAVAKSINEVVRILTDGSSQVTQAAQQIASSSEELSQSTTEQASSLEETASSIEEMNSMVQKNADNAKRTSELASSSNESAEKGKNVVLDMLKAIDDINESNNTIKAQIDDSNQKISDIVQVISEIGNKTKVINDIVFQTKLLSFNASVEAARAGEHGKGFAVVAEEVGNLAEMSGNAAKEISAMLEGSIQKVEGIVNETKTKVTSLIHDGRNKIDAGIKIARECETVLSEIVDNVSSVTQMANEISTACQEQATGVQEITKAMGQLDQVTQLNASTSEQVASSAEELSGQAESLRSAVTVLVKTIHGNDGSAPAAVAPTNRIHTPMNVVQLKKTKVKEVRPMEMKKAVGMDFRTIPSENDPRFEDV